MIGLFMLCMMVDVVYPAEHKHKLCGSEQVSPIAIVARFLDHIEEPCGKMQQYYFMRREPQL
jgi:hypothetical protein